MALTFLVSEKDEATIGKEALQSLSKIYGQYLAPKQAEVELSCSDLAEMQDLNRETRQINEPTDVLSFPIFPNKEAAVSHPGSEPVLLGSIVLCPEKAVLYKETLPQLVHHGLLHVCGFDHETDLKTWKQEEEILLNQLTKAGLTIPGIPL